MNYQDSNKNRLLKSFKRERSDRVPYWEAGVDKVIVEHVLGRNLRGDRMSVEEHVEFAARTGMDAVGMAFYYSPGRISVPDEYGRKHYVNGAIKNRNDFKKFEQQPMDFSPHIERLEKYLEATQNTDIGVWAYVHGPLDPVYLGMGLETFWLMLYDDFAFVERVMDHILDVHIQIVKILLDKGVDFVHIGDDVALKNGLVINPEMFADIYPSRLEKLVKPAKEKNVPVTFHSDGKIDDLIPHLVNAGIRAIHPIEPYSNDIYNVKKKFGDQITLMGNVELTGRDAETVFLDTKKHFELLADGAYVLTSSHSVTHDVPPENYEAMLKALHEFGCC